jgi:RNA polymerase-interacting CarD/CdnL/TRCF family regulator
MPRHQFSQAAEQNLAEPFGRMQQHLLQHLRTAQQRQTAELVRRIYRQNQFRHFSSW